MSAQYVETQDGVYASVQVVIERFVAGRSGVVERKVACQWFAREGVDVDQFVVAPAGRNGFEVAEAQAPGQEQCHNEQ